MREANFLGGTENLDRRRQPGPGVSWPDVTSTGICAPHHPAQDLGAESSAGGGSRRQVLLAYNGSSTSEAALDFLAHAPQFALSRVLVLYVRIYDITRGGCYFLETRREAEVCAHEAANRLRVTGLEADAVVRNGRRDKVTALILAEAEAFLASSIVLGTRDHTRLIATLRGSISARVARRSHTPVVLVNPDRPCR